MSNVFEYEGKTVEKALKIAAKELKIAEGELKHEVISYGSTGIFGLVGTKKAKIRVTVPRAKLDSQDIAQPPQPPEEKSEDEADQSVHESIDATFKKAAELSERQQAGMEKGSEALEKIIDFITSDAKVIAEQTKDEVSYKVKGGNSAVLIGKRGQTLDAIQYLVEKVVNKQSRNRVRVQVDVEGYLEKRESSLRKMASRLAEKAKRTGKPMSVGQMNANDRRIIHLTLKGDNSVRTQSMGEGFLRKLVIFPKKGAVRNKRARE